MSKSKLLIRILSKEFILWTKNSFLCIIERNWPPLCPSLKFPLFPRISIECWAQGQSDRQKTERDEKVKI